MHTGNIVNNKINGYSLEEWKSFLEEDLTNKSKKIKLIEKMKGKMTEEMYLQKLKDQEKLTKFIEVDINTLNKMLNP